MRAKPSAEAVEFEVVEAGALPYADNGFVAAASWLVLSFIGDADRALAKM